MESHVCALDGSAYRRLIRLISNNANNVSKIMDLDFKNISPGHGPAQIGDAKEDLKEGFALIKPYTVWQCEPVAE